MVGEKDAPEVIAQGVVDFDDLPSGGNDGGGEGREVSVPLVRPLTKRAVGTLTLLVRA